MKQQNTPVTWYRTSLGSYGIQSFLILRESKTNIWIALTDSNGKPVSRHEAKISKHAQWHSTYESAANQVVAWAWNHIARAHREIHRAYDIIKELKP